MQLRKQHELEITIFNEAPEPTPMDIEVTKQSLLSLPHYGETIRDILGTNVLQRNLFHKFTL